MLDWSHVVSTIVGGALTFVGVNHRAFAQVLTGLEKFNEPVYKEKLVTYKEILGQVAFLLYLLSELRLEHSMDMDKMNNKRTEFFIKLDAYRFALFGANLLMSKEVFETGEKLVLSLSISYDPKLAFVRWSEYEVLAAEMRKRMRHDLGIDTISGNIHRVVLCTSSFLSIPSRFLALFRKDTGVKTGKEKPTADGHKP